jgi:galactose mutarotase-like enzyme
MTYTLENDQIHIRIHAKGAELCSLQNRKNGLEYLWQADPSVWNRHAPVLFPIVGKLRDNQYEWEGKTYPLPQHGFARDQVFEVLHQETDRLTLTLKANEETQKVYPFSFELRITHALHANRVDITYQVIHHGKEDMFFSIGSHPAFNCPLLPGEAFEDYFLEFEQPETLERHLLENGLFNGQTQPLLREEKVLALQRSLFEQDAIVISGYQSQSVTLKSRKNNHQIQVDFPDFPWLGIWTKNAQSPFVCIEPWYGLADSTDATGRLADKNEIRQLTADASFTCTHSITVS